MRGGEKATVTCPPNLIDFDIDKTTDVNGSRQGRKYELHVQECDMHPAYFIQDKLKDDTCFYIRPTGWDGQASNLALNVDELDLYYPNNYGIFNVQAKEYLGDNSANIAQQFTYRSSDNAIVPRLHPQTALFEGGNGNIIAYTSLGYNQ